MERPDFDLGTILESPLGSVVQFEPVKRKYALSSENFWRLFRDNPILGETRKKGQLGPDNPISTWQTKKLSYPDLLNHTAEDIDPRVLLILQWTLVVPAKLDIEGMTSEDINRELRYGPGYFITQEKVEKVNIPEIYEPDFEYWHIGRINDDVSDFLATKLALFGLKHPDTRLPIMKAGDLNDCTRDLATYMSTPDQAIFRAHSGIQNIASPERVQEVINAGIITPENLDDYFASISYWAKSFAKFFSDSESVDKRQVYPFSLSTYRQNYDLRFLPFLMVTHLQYLSELPESVNKGELCDVASLKTSTTHLGIAVQNSIRTQVVERIGIDIKATDGSIGDLFNQLKILNPESAREVATVVTQLKQINPLVNSLFEVYRTNPWLLNRTVPGWDQRRLGALPHLATISNEINQFGGKAPRKPEYFQVKFNTRSGQV